MATKPKAILSTHDGREASPITKASNVLFENGQTAQDILNDRQDAMISPVIENSSSMFKVGQGDDVDYSANVVNGAYEGMVLKGKTMVNCIQEPSSEDVVLPYEFEEGRYVTINDTKESGALGVELKGQTLVNTFICEHTIPLSGATISDNTITLDKSQQWSRIHLLPSNSLWIPNETYTTILYDVVGDTSTLHMCSQNGGGATKTPFMNNKAVFTMGRGRDTDKDNRLGYIESSTVVENETVSFKVVILKGDYSDVDVPYFTGMASCKMPILRTVGKNLFDSTQLPTYAVQDAVVGFGGVFKSLNNGVYTTANYGAIGWDIALEEGQTYTLSLKGRYLMDKNTNSSGFMCTIGINNKLKDNRVYGEARTITHSYTFVATKTTKIGIGIVAYGVDGTDCEIYDIQLEKTSSATTYEPHKTSILSLPEEVVLRSLPNGVRDTFNTRTGVYTQRIEEVVLDNSQTYLIPTGESFETIQRFKLVLSKNIKTSTTTTNGIAICDKLKIEGTSLADEERMFITTGNSGSIMYFNLLKTKATNLTELQSYLQSNPITVQYELETPIVTKINLPSTLKSWNTTTHIHSEIPENSLYPILSHSNPSYPVILKPSTKYSIVANSYSNNHTNSAINFNLGGSTASTTVGNRVTTITTPSILSNELLTMSGRGNKLNNVMVIEGDVVGDESYFEGICDCKSPILSNVGKNLFDNVFTVGGWWDGVPDCNPDFMRSVNLTPVKPNTSYAYDSTVKGHRQSANFMAHDADGNFIKYLGFGRTFTTPSNCHYIHLYRENDDSLYAQIEEGAVSTTIEPYKSNILSANGDKIELTEDMFEQGTTAQYTANIGKTYQWMKENSTSSWNARRLRLKELIKIQPNTKLILQNTDNFMYAIAGYDANKLSLGTFDTGWVQNTTITIPQDVHYISFSIRKKDDTSITISDFKNTKFTLSEVDKTIVLRSLPNGVCDTLNVETGEYVQRIGELVMSGSLSEEWQVWTGTQNTESVYTFQLNRCNNEPSGTMSVCDKYLTYFNASKLNATLGEGVALNTGNGYLRILKTKVGSGSVDELKTYLASNPITVQYELTTPIIKTVDLSGYPFSYENGHVILSSGSIEQSLTPTVEYSVATNRNGQIRSNQKMVERHQKQLDQLQAIILANLVNSQYNQTLTTLKYELSRV